MKRLLVGAAAVALAVFTGARAVPAQLPGLPVYNTPVPAGFTIVADVGFPSNSTRTGTSYAATGAFGTGAFGFTLSIGGTSSGFPKLVYASPRSWWASANWRLIAGLRLSHSGEPNLFSRRPIAVIASTKDLSGFPSRRCSLPRSTNGLACRGSM